MHMKAAVNDIGDLFQHYGNYSPKIIVCFTWGNLRFEQRKCYRVRQKNHPCSSAHLVPDPWEAFRSSPETPLQEQDHS